MYMKFALREKNFINSGVPPQTHMLAWNWSWNFSTARCLLPFCSVLPQYHSHAYIWTNWMQFKEICFAALLVGCGSRMKAGGTPWWEWRQKWIMRWHYTQYLIGAHGAQSDNIPWHDTSHKLTRGHKFPLFGGLLAERLWILTPKEIWTACRKTGWPVCTIFTEIFSKFQFLAGCCEMFDVVYFCGQIWTQNLWQLISFVSYWVRVWFPPSSQDRSRSLSLRLERAQNKQKMQFLQSLAIKMNFVTGTFPFSFV